MESEELTYGQFRADLTDLIPLIRRVVAARARDENILDDVVQETLVRVMVAQERLDDSALIPYAVVVARNLVTAHWRRDERVRQQAHLLVESADDPLPEEQVLQQEERRAVTYALSRLSDQERRKLLAHEVDGQGTAEMATRSGSSAGAVAAQLHRTRAKLRVEYLLALEADKLPTQRCRPVLLALSGGDRRRQRELDAAGHILECSNCSKISGPLFDRLQDRSAVDDVILSVRADKDVVRARQRGREVAAGAGFSSTELTLIATAISEVVRNIVRFAHHGELRIQLVEDAHRRGVLIVARDVGPGIPDVERALEDGYSTYGGMGLGLPGARRLMDEFHIASEVGKGTTITMARWHPHD